MRVSVIFVSALPAALSICFQQPVQTIDKRPRDFAIEYHWRAGSVPPPYHFEYTIIIDSSGRGEVTMIPDYPSDTVPRWTESFSVGEKEADQLYQVMVESGVFARGWKPLARQPIGGSSRSLTVTANGKRIVIDRRLASDEEALAETISSAVAETVPKVIWDKLNSQREDYMRTHSRR